MKSLFIALVAFLELAGCHTDLNPGRCNSSSDCPTGQSCDLAQNGVCVCNTAGCADGGAGTGGTGGGTTGLAGNGGTGGSAGIGADGGGLDADASHGCHTTCAAPTPICANGTCVGCVSDADCGTTTKPICDTAASICRACAVDSECLAEPGVCMAHQDGRCATVGETIYVQNNTTICSDTATQDPGFGTATKPLCSMQPVANLLSVTKDLVVVRGTAIGGTWTFSGQGAAQTTIVGQSTAVLGNVGAPGFSMQLGSVYLRDLMVTATSASGIKATGGTLQLDAVTIDSCTGGGLFLDGAAFTVRNSTISNNSGGKQGGLGWGGILVNSLPASGPSEFKLVTVENNRPNGINCAGPITADGVFATGNMSADIATDCGFGSCPAASSTCGAQ